MPPVRSRPCRCARADQRVNHARFWNRSGDSPPASFGIVQGNPPQPLVPDDPIELAKCFLHCTLRADVVASGENVSGIEANAKPLGFPHFVNDLRNLFETVTET